MTAHRQTLKIRKSLLSAVLRQEVSWFDTHEAGQIISRLSEYVTCTVHMKKKFENLD
jgi:ABC-type multidrug transport system fused ATPase/permease subunit